MVLLTLLENLEVSKWIAKCRGIVNGLVPSIIVSIVWLNRELADGHPM
jgi:hypothetical protein